MSEGENAAPVAAVHTAPFRVVDSQGRTVLEVTEEGGLRLNSPMTGLPRMEFGAFEVTEGLRSVGLDSTNNHVGLWVFDRLGRRVAGLASMEFDEDPEHSYTQTGFGATLLWARSDIPAVELRGDFEGDGELLLRAPTADYPGHWGARLYCHEGDARLVLNQSIAMKMEDGSTHTMDAPIALGCSCD